MHVWWTLITNNLFLIIKPIHGHENQKKKKKFKRVHYMFVLSHRKFNIKFFYGPSNCHNTS